MNNKFFSLRRVLLLAALLLAAWLIYPLIFGSKKLRDPEEVAVRMDAAPNSFNPYLSKGHGPSNFVSRQTLQTLGEIDPKTLEMKPQLVTAIPSVYTVKEGARAGQLAYDFEIIPEASWDNGSPITGKDVLFTFKIIAHPGLPVEAFRGFFDYLAGVEVDAANPKKFTAYFKQFYILNLESICSVPIYPAYNYDPAGRMNAFSFNDLRDTSKTATLLADANLKAFAEEFSQPKFANDPNAISGSGPYRMEVMNEQGVIMVKKQNWWGDKVADKYPMLAAYPKKILYKVVKDEVTLENMLKNGELSIVGGVISPSKFLEMKTKDSLTSKFDFFALGSTQYNRLLLNLRNPILSDVKVRHAISHLLDYNYFVENVQQNLAVRLANPVPLEKPFYAKDIPLIEFNVPKAKQLLAEAGWSDKNGDGILEKEINGVNTKLTLSLHAPTSSKTNELIANSMKETMRQGGIELLIVGVDLATISVDTRNGKYDCALLGVSLYSGLVEFYQRYHSHSLAPAGDNRSGYANAEADSLIEAIRVESDEAKRNMLYIKAQQVLNRDMPEIVLYAPLQRVIISKKLAPGIESKNRPGYYEQLAREKK